MELRQILLRGTCRKWYDIKNKKYDMKNKNKIRIKYDIEKVFLFSECGKF